MRTLGLPIFYDPATILFRPPYFGDAEPTTPGEVDPIVGATRLGHLTIGLRVDSDDWTLPGTSHIVRRTVDGVTATLGMIAMPNVWIFQILFPLIAPVMDLMLAWAFISAALQRVGHPAEYVATNLREVLFYYAVFLAVDWLTAAFALLLEKRERASLLWWLLLQRFCYRQLMYWVVFKSVIGAARGALIGWGKLDRKATAEAQP